MQIHVRKLPEGGQYFATGNVVNVPVDIQPTISSLPRKLDEIVTVPNSSEFYKNANINVMNAGFKKSQPRHMKLLKN